MRHRPLIAVALMLSPAVARTQDLDDFVRQAAERNAIPSAWIHAVITAESGGDDGAMSGAGAMGLMQLMPDTWKALRHDLNLGADPFDPHDNIAAGTAYLRWLHDRYGDAGFLAAYNAGPARYDAHLATGRPLPDETISYVAHVQTLIGNPSVFLSGLASKIVSDWRAGSLFIGGKTTSESLVPVAVSTSRNAASAPPFPAEFFPARDALQRPDFFVSRSAPEQDGDARTGGMKP
ncbi:lytic transglycosylase domain-containing protein [Gluconacetobacter aggeris]|uniref:Lytic transglycosylase domain-containing protein n=1 Tax=Gluconacetobacter aggeris TaxID=1286186 RepID=A0A7W4IVE2_9PROT|nr:lytic transglycosylase domain-containing protein [Gluconacetobacter aggeris]MBB2169668.1 lytic transglycosylase domain-containing protein [Gluconacetobacter aggeris]